MNVASVLRDPRAAQQAHQRAAESFFREVDSIAFNHSGDAKSWMNQAESMSFRAASFAARSTLGVDEQRVGDGMPSGVAAQNAAFADRVNGFARGYGDAHYWFGRTKAMSIVAATHALTVASMCDGAMAAAVRPAIEQGLRTAEGAHTGNGDAHYWSGRASRLASDLSGLARLSAPGVDGTSAFGAELQRIDQRFGDEVEGLIFGYSGDVNKWLYRTQYIGLRAAEYAARKTMLLASQREDSVSDRAAAVDRIKALTTQFVASSDRSAEGYGDADYWLKRTTAYAVRATEFANSVAAECDAPLLRAVQPVLEEMLSTAETTAYSGSGYASYWSSRLKTLTVDLKARMEAVRIDAQAEAAAQAVPVPEQPIEGIDRHAVEKDVERNRVKLEEWNGYLSARAPVAASLTSEMNALALKINPLVERDQKIVPWLNRAGLAVLPSAVATFMSFSAAQSLGAAGPVVLGVAGLALAVSLGAKLILGGRHREIMSQYTPLNDRYQSLSKQQGWLSQETQLGSSHAKAAEVALKAAQGQLEVHKMAESLSPAKPPAEAVTVDTGTVKIGKLSIPRRVAPETPTDASA